MIGRDVSINTFSYELAYAQRDPFAGDAPYMDALMPYLAEHAPPPASVLDIGAGTGRLAIPLAKQGYRVTMLEPAASGMRRAHEKACAAGVQHLISYVCGEVSDITRLGCNAFDIVLGIQSVLFEDDLGTAVRNMLAVARNVVCFDVASLYGFLASRMPGFQVTPANMLHVLEHHRTPGEWNLHDEQYRCYTLEEIRAIACEAGLEVDEILPVSFQEVYGWQGDPDDPAVPELERRLREDQVLRHLSGFHLVLARKPSTEAE